MKQSLSESTEKATLEALKYQTSIFEQNLPNKPYCAYKSDSGYIRPTITTVRKALKRDLIQLNHPGRRVWLPFDIDLPYGAWAWEYADLPGPFFTCVNRLNGHAHSAWLLEVPVVMADWGRAAPMYKLERIERAMTAALHADPDYSGLLTKNPVSPAHRVLWDPALGTFTLDRLELWLPDIEKFNLIRNKDQLTGVGRNVDTFDAIRHWSYKAVILRKLDGVTFQQWQDELIEQCLVYTAQEHGNAALPYPECRYIARSIGKWTWARFTPERYNELKSQASQRSHAKRWGDRSERDGLIITMFNDGRSCGSIAKELGICNKTAGRVIRAYEKS